MEPLKRLEHPRLAPADDERYCRAERLHHRCASPPRGQRNAARSLGIELPTSTMVQVVSLGRPELLLEINAIAVTR